MPLETDPQSSSAGKKPPSFGGASFCHRQDLVAGGGSTWRHLAAGHIRHLEAAKTQVSIHAEIPRKRRAGVYCVPIGRHYGNPGD